MKNELKEAFLRKYPQYRELLIGEAHRHPSDFLLS